MQKILSTRSPEDASKMSGFVNIILLPIRYAFIIGLTVLGLLFYQQMNLKDANGIVDFERILPVVINNFLPVGLVGLVLTGLLGAFMGTFSGTLNAAQAYIINDVYLKYINPQAPNKTIIYANYLVGIAVVIIGIVLGFFAKDVNSILQWIVSALYGGYVASNILKWHWWRFNANGFFWGMLSGIVAALIFTHFFTGIEFLYYFPVLFLISLTGSVVGSYASPATDIKVLISFYKTVRPWGLWDPVKKIVMDNDPQFVPNNNFKINMFNVCLGVIAQSCLTILPMYFVLKQNISLAVTSAILIIISLILKKTWWDRLSDY
jgi:SSS family solute:Na+ symporter